MIEDDHERTVHVVYYVHHVYDHPCDDYHYHHHCCRMMKSGSAGDTMTPHRGNGESTHTSVAAIHISTVPTMTVVLHPVVAVVAVAVFAALVVLMLQLLLQLHLLLLGVMRTSVSSVVRRTWVTVDTCTESVVASSD